MLEPMHIGDGAYITDKGYGFLITANHHLASLATDKVWIERGDAEKLIRYLEAAISPQDGYCGVTESDIY